MRLPEVKNRTGLSRTEIYRRMDDGTFPKAIPLGKRSVAWRSDEIDAWIEERIGQASQVAATRQLRRTMGRLQSMPR